MSMSNDVARSGSGQYVGDVTRIVHAALHCIHHAASAISKPHTHNIDNSESELATSMYSPFDKPSFNLIVTPTLCSPVTSFY